MLHNPWNQPPAEVTAEPLDAKTLPASLRDLVRRKLGDVYTPGFGYISTVLIGPRSVLKFDRFPGRSGRFDHDRAVSGFTISDVSMPELLDDGVADGYEWIEQSLVPGAPAYLHWSRMDVARQRELMESLARAISQIQGWPVDQRLLHSRYSDWRGHVAGAVERSITGAEGIVPEAHFAAARSRATEWGARIELGDSVVTCHGDLWFGNVFVDPVGRLSGIIDWDRLAVAPAVYELDMLWRFWRYPWNFVPEEWEPAYMSQLPPDLLAQVVGKCVPPGCAGSAAATLSMLELAYRLGMARRFGWGTQLQEMLDTVLTGTWADGLLEG